MKRKIEISIETPCGEDYESSKTTSLGGYCQKCKKEVVDFSNYRSSELYTYFDTQSGKVCGKFRPEQLTTISKSQNVGSFTARLVAASISLLTMISSKPTLAQDLNQYTQTDKTADLSQEKHIMAKEDLEYKTIELSGVVIDAEDKLALRGARVSLKGTDKGTITDENGVFVLPLTDHELVNGTLVFSCVGFKMKEAEALQIQDNPISMELDIAVLGGVCYKRPFPSNFWHWITWPFRR